MLIRCPLYNDLTSSQPFSPVAYSFMISTASTPTVTAFPTDAQRALYCTMPDIGAPIQDLCNLDLGPLHPLALTDMAADWTSPSGLVFLSMDPLATRTSNEGREVKVS